MKQLHGTLRRLSGGHLTWALVLAVLLAGCGGASRAPDTFGALVAKSGHGQHGVPTPDHIVIVVEENKAYSQIIDSAQAPYINRLANEGAWFTHAYGETHPSQPGYLALFSGSTQGMDSDRCADRLTGPNLASELVAAGYSFVTYSQSLPSVGFTGCRDGLYARKHNPAVNWQGGNVSASQNQPFTAFPEDFNDLPTVALVAPDLTHDMHNGDIAAGDRWLKDELGDYADWARDHNSLLIVTWDEDNRWHHNRIPTVIVGESVKPGSYARPINHYSLLRTVLAMYDLPPLGKSGDAAPITDSWK